MSTELVVAETGTTELALPSDLIDRARDFAVNARSERTRKEYARCWRQFEAWCSKHHRLALPASIETVVAYVTWLADGGDKGKPLAVSSIEQALAAIKLAQRMGGYPFDTKNAALVTVMKGIRREIAKTRLIRRVKPLMADELRVVLESLNPTVLREARDAAVIGLCWAAALRRSELVGLDFGKLGSGTGFVSIDDKAITITLMTSKGSQDTAQTVVVPRIYAPLSAQAFDTWVALANIEPGTPIFRAVIGKGESKRIAATRMCNRTVARIIKQRVKVLAKGRKLSKESIKAFVELFSGHSMRVGYVSSARTRRMDRGDVMRHTRHKTERMIEIYDRAVDKAGERSGLNGVGV